MGEGRAEAGFVVAELGLGDGQLLADGVAFGVIAAGQTLESIEDGAGAMVLEETRLACGGSLEIKVGGELGMKQQAEA